MSVLSELFKEMFEIDSLPEKEYKTYILIERYRDKVSKRLLNKQKEIRELGKELFSKQLNEIVNIPNPFFNLMPKDNFHFSVPLSVLFPDKEE